MSTECKKRSCDESTTSIEIVNKRPRYCWYFKLESESSCASQEDAESVYSIQNQETDIAKDTSDTDTKSICSDTDLEVELEYEVESDNDCDNPLCVSASSSGTDDALAAVGAITAAICDSSYEAWATGETDSESSSSSRTLGDDDDDDGNNASLQHSKGDFWTCAQCKSLNNNPRFQFCDRCFQVRKSIFPPRPRRKKKSKAKKEKNTPVKLESLQSCLNGLSQDSGLGSSQEFPSLQLEKIVVPPHLTTAAAAAAASPSTSTAITTSPANNRKRQLSESSLSEFEEWKKRPKLEEKKTEKVEMITKTSDEQTSSTTTTTTSSGEKVCIICNISPRNSIFLHGRIGHMCSCYRCAMRTWGINKRCPLCNCKVRNVIKVFTA